MQYISTRGNDTGDFEHALMRGLARDGGLFVPDHFPDFTHLWRTETALPYRTLAKQVILAYWPEANGDDIERILAETYTKERFGDELITPLLWLSDDLALLRLSNGPTLSFKDVALQLIIRLMSYVLAKQGRTLTLILATSGDTGSAAAEAVRGIANIRLFVLIPKGRISEFQRRQMSTITEDNVFILEVDAPFDDLQKMVKDVFVDRDFSERYRVSGVNSINWARIVAQSIYWMHACGQVRQRHPGVRRIIGNVPTGNFGDIYGGYVGRRCGFPLDLVACTNENRVIHDCVTTGIYRPWCSDEVIPTTSPSMDIAIASNFERLLFELVRRNTWHLDALMAHVARGQSIEVDRGSIAAHRISSAMATQAQVMETIKRTYDTWNIIIDPHTATAMHAVGVDSGAVTLVAETALPAKFLDTIEEALGFRPPMTTAQQAMFTRAERLFPLKADVEEFKAFIAAH